MCEFAHANPFEHGQEEEEGDEDDDEETIEYVVHVSVGEGVQEVLPVPNVLEEMGNSKK